MRQEIYTKSIFTVMICLKLDRNIKNIFNENHDFGIAGE